MDFKTYQERAIKTAIYDMEDAITYPALGLGGEVGELQGKISKVMRDKSFVFGSADLKDLSKEIGDCLWFLAALADDFGLSLDQIAEENLDKLKDRAERNVISGSGDDR
jgi:NTP pyrophosphatase (non-canonical NTP hydrolase)